MTTLYPEPPEPTPEIRRDRRIIALAIPGIAIVFAFIAYQLFPFRNDVELLHVSYDASREFYSAFNQAFLDEQPEANTPAIRMSHAGSVRQVSNLAHGQIADIVSLASAYDLQSVIEQSNCPDPDWQDRLPHHSSPFHSSIALVVRRGNPRQIRDWQDLWNPQVKLAIPGPSHSGAGRWAFLALQSAARASTRSDSDAAHRLQSLYLAITPFEAGARTALSLFANRSDIDAFLTWESDALMLETLGFEQLEAVFFPNSVLAEPCIAQLSCYVDKRETSRLANAYLDFHFSETGQRLAVTHHLRPSDASFSHSFPATVLAPISPDDWSNAFSPNGLYQRVETLRFARKGGYE